MTAWTVTEGLSAAETETVFRWIGQESYWARGLPRPIFDRSLQNSLCFALRDGQGGLRGFARVVTDRATFAYLCDVFVCPSTRGKGGGKALIRAVLDHPDLQDLRRWMLVTRDAHGLYAPFGFEPLADPARVMVRVDPGIYARLNAGGGGNGRAPTP
ncbi:GNAT family N-acetyltransferase [Microvirga thermotolerans]|uniref:GNAT family N-acetyltransferase n=1 Tax=Microvirga thermotolerans TaxID=2651334 RepID=A0A5P9K3F5_9HYPH|nr:GNAT family N-acetyltransferase [Microvirga thermotolerans]QFU16794.1 GNAT family N-acetyltransferase [Microvirga thermotolerans]